MACCLSDRDARSLRKWRQNAVVAWPNKRIAPFFAKALRGPGTVICLRVESREVGARRDNAGRENENWSIRDKISWVGSRGSDHHKSSARDEDKPRADGLGLFLVREAKWQTARIERIPSNCELRSIFVYNCELIIPPLKSEIQDIG
jgi:hypothetical protein